VEKGFLSRSLPLLALPGSRQRAREHTNGLPLLPPFSPRGREASPPAARANRSFSSPSRGSAPSTSSPSRRPPSTSRPASERAPARPPLRYQRKRRRATTDEGERVSFLRKLRQHVRGGRGLRRQAQVGTLISATAAACIIDRRRRRSRVRSLPLPISPRRGGKKRAQ